jgi:hypothetical protein
VPQNDNCPFDHYCAANNECVPGCKSNAECAALAEPDGGAGDGGAGDLGAAAGGTGIDVLCDPNRHTCVQCVQQSDCPAGQVCSPAGTCLDGCDLTKGKLCKPGLTCCNNYCVDTTSDRLNCNQCGHSCSMGESCCSSTCTNTGSDTGHCGSCTTACSMANAVPSCTSGVCSWSCSNGFAHCMNGNTGCETNLSAAGEKLCGAACIAQTSCCTTADCSTPPTPAACYQAGVCSGAGGTCSYALNAGSVICGSTCCNGINGSCNPDCTLACNAGFADCDSNPANGCETPTNTITNCGGCGNICNMANASSVTCDGTKCVYLCMAPFANCSMTPPNTGGCSVNTSTDVNNCGACFRGCSTSEVGSGGPSCSGGVCNSTCAANYGNCSNPAAPSADDGCESNLLTCAGTPCCGTLCTATHQNGTGQTYTDCSPLGVPGTNTYTVNMATEAAMADTNQVGTIVMGTPMCNPGKPDELDFVCKSSTGSLSGGNGFTCTCWAYYAPGTSATALSKVGSWVTQGSNKFCLCPAGGAQTWN